jgi:acetylornithine/N-succinyldiaminopimelate aminotransferase
MDEDFLASVREKSDKLRSALSEMSKVKGLDGLGLMVGIDLDGMTGAEAVNQLMAEGALAIPAQSRLRLLPPLTISDEELEQAIAVLKKVLD